MAVPARWRLCVPLLILMYISVRGQNVFRSFQYKYSFKPPYLAQKDGSVPFWEYSGSEYDFLMSLHMFIRVPFYINHIVNFLFF